MDQTISKKIRDLINYLNQCTKKYDEGNPIISDKDWDTKYFELQDLEKEFGIVFPDSPTSSISYKVVNSLEKVEHNHDMLSLEKTKVLQEVKDFLGNVPYLAMCKMDGLTCSLMYENGMLISAETRGNGKVGENILHNAKVIPSIPKEIPYKEKLIVDGEIICTYKDFEKFKDEYKNPRNFASGSIRLLNSKECAERHLTFVAWDIIEGFNYINSLTDRFDLLKACGFIIVPNYCVIKNNYELNINKQIDLIKNFANELSYPIDGVVFKFDDINYGKTLGKTSHHFKNALAFKFYDETYTTKIKSIEWTMGRTGVLTPIAIFEPIEIDGSIVSRASLHNLSIFKASGLKYQGQKVDVLKANQIIPQISKVYEYNSEIGSIAGMEIPEVCPICGEKLSIKKDNDSEFLICSNSNCEGKFINKLDHFCGKKGLDIKGLSKATLSKLMDWGWLNSYEDLFKLNAYATEWKQKPGFGEKSVEKILTAIDAGSKCELTNFIAAIGIPLIGSTASKDLVKYFPTWENFMDAVDSGYHFWEIPNFGSEMNSAIINFDYTEAKNLYKNYLTIKSSTKEEKKENNNNLDGISIVITGKLLKFKNRDALKESIENHGGKVVGSVSSKTTYLINNDANSTSSKNMSAKKNGIPILSEEEFIEMFNLL